MSKLALPVIIVAVASMAGAFTLVFIKQQRIENLTAQIEAPNTGFKAQVKSCNADFEAERKAFTSANGEVRRQSAEIRRMAEASAKLRADTSRALQAARTKYEQLGAAQRLLALRQPPGNACDAALALMKAGSK